MLIGEVSQRSGVSARMLRHYDRIGLVSPTVRTRGGYREYSEEDIRRLFHVEGLRSLGLSLQDISGALDDLSYSPAAMVEDLIARTRERLAREEQLLRRLEQVRASAPEEWADVLRTIGLLRGLDSADPSDRQRLALVHGALMHGGEEDRDAALLAEAVLNEADPNAAGALEWALSQTGDDAVPILTEALASPVAERRRRAVAALGKIGSPRACRALAAAFQNPDPHVSGRAALARGRLGEGDAIPALVALVVAGDDDVEASDVLGALAVRHGRTAEVIGAVASALAGSDGEARRRLAAALADVPGGEAEELLTALLEDPDRRVVLTASFLLRSR